MHEYTVTIPGWSEGKPLVVTGVRGDTVHDAYRSVLDSINRAFGSSYDSLPVDTVVRQVSA